MSNNAKTLPLMEIIVLTLVRSDIPVENIPKVRVLQQGETYAIIEGREFIQRALAEGFEKLEEQFQTSFLFAVDLEKNEESN